MLVCVDDEREILNSLVWDLRALEDIVEIEQCGSGEEAMEVLRDIVDNPAVYPALVMTDQMMPGKKGVDILRFLQETA